MLKKSHRSFGVSLTPLMFLPSKYLLNKNLFLFNTFYDIQNFLYSALFFLSYFIGLTFPDIDMKLKYLYPKSMRNERYRYHRQITHSILLSIILIYICIKYLSGYLYYGLFGLTIGIIGHQLGDMITGSIPWLFYGPYYVRFSRIGITVFLPKVMHKIFTEKFPKWLNKHLWIFVIIFIFNVILVVLIQKN